MLVLARYCGELVFVRMSSDPVSTELATDLAALDYLGQICVTFDCLIGQVTCCLNIGRSNRRLVLECLELLNACISCTEAKFSFQWQLLILQKGTVCRLVRCVDHTSLTSCSILLRILHLVTGDRGPTLLLMEHGA